MKHDVSGLEKVLAGRVAQDADYFRLAQRGLTSTLDRLLFQCLACKYQSEKRTAKSQLRYRSYTVVPTIGAAFVVPLIS